MNHNFSLENILLVWRRDFCVLCINCKTLYCSQSHAVELGLKSAPLSSAGCQTCPVPWSRVLGREGQNQEEIINSWSLSGFFFFFIFLCLVCWLFLVVGLPVGALKHGLGRVREANFLFWMFFPYLKKKKYHSALHPVYHRWNLICIKLLKTAVIIPV